LHEDEARHHGLRLHYQLIDLESTGATVERLPSLIDAARTIGFAGLNITYPCKQAVIPLLDDLSDEARALGAVNTVTIRQGRIVGHNTDGSAGVGVSPRPARRGREPHRAVGRGWRRRSRERRRAATGAQQLVIVDREADRAQALADRLNTYHAGDRASASTDIEAALHGATGIVHCTPTGMDKLPGLPLPADLLRADLWVSEIVYFPLETALLKAARAKGCRTVDAAHGGGPGDRRLPPVHRREPDAARMERHSVQPRRSVESATTSRALIRADRASRARRRDSLDDQASEVALHARRVGLAPGEQAEGADRLATAMPPPSTVRQPLALAALSRAVSSGK